MAVVSKGVTAIATALSCAAGFTTWRAGTSGTTLSVTTQWDFGVSGTLTNGTAPTVAPIVVLAGSNDGGTTWWFINRAVGILTAGSITDFSFNQIPGGWATLNLFVYNNATNVVTLDAYAAYITGIS